MIARIERGDDLKLSTLFDYLAALNLTPAGKIAVGSYSDAVKGLPGADRIAETEFALASEERATTDPATD